MAENTLEARTIGKKNCGDGSTFGKLSTRYDFVMKGLTNDLEYPKEACKPWLHFNMKVGNLRALATISSPMFKGGTFVGTFQGTINVQSWKGFDIKHPNKKNHRLRHICLEGPEAGVYYRGRLKDSNVIDIPEYWIGLIDPETITVSLTQIGYTQDLIIDKIEWGRKIIVRSGNGANIDCYYVIHAARVDGEQLIVEYEGESPSDYPGDPSQYSISGYDYGVKK